MKYCICENEKPLKKQAVTEKYTASGLSNVTLVGVEYYKCDVCGEEFFGYGDMEQLHRVIAQAIITKKTLLLGGEVKFLRKHLGYSAEMFGRLLKYDKDTVYRIESGKQPVTPRLDGYLRMLFLLKSPDRNYDLHDILLADKKPDAERLEFKHAKSGEWKLAA